jgi:hypothetical protein
MSSFTYTSKFLSLAPYLLMEYRYGTEPNPEYHPTNFGTSTVGFERIVNGYFNDAVQITNRTLDQATTGNVRDKSSVQISQNTFVRLDIDRLQQYLDYDNKLTDTGNLPVTFETNLNVYYDTIRYHFLSGFDFGQADGAILQVQFPERSGKQSTVSQITYEKGDLDITKMNPTPIYFNGGIYDNYIEIKIPSYSVITYEYETQAALSSADQTVASKISSDGKGFIKNKPFTVSLFEIQTTQTLSGFYYYNTQINTTATITPFDEYGDLAANILENTTFDYFEYFPSWKGNFIEDFVYLEESLGNKYYIIHDIEVAEQVGLRSITTQRIQVLQDKDFNAPYIFRPVILNPRATSFTISYSMRLVNKFNNISILRVATLTSTEVDKYGPGLKRINLLHQPYPQKVYNKVVEPIVSKAYTLNVNPIERVITKYVPAFFERDSVNITEENLTIDSLGNLKQDTTKDATIAFGQGKGKIVINPYDNYYKFRIFTKNDGKENTVLDLGNNTEFYLNFEGGLNKTVKVTSLQGSTFQNPSKGELVFKLVEADSKKIMGFTDRDFHIVSKTANGIETSIYHGYWILPSERDQKPVPVTTAAPAPAPTPVVIAAVESTPTQPVVNVIPQQPSTYFDPKSTPIAISVPPKETNTTTVTEPTITPIKTKGIDINALALAIKTDEQAGKNVKTICDYYLIKGRPGNNLFLGVTNRIFLEAARLVHPDTSKGRRSMKFIEYCIYLGIIYDPNENNQYPTGGTTPKTGGGCFLAGTEVTLFNGSTSKIEDIDVGTLLMTYNEESGAQEHGLVASLIRPQITSYIKITLSNSTEIRCTAEHPFWVNSVGWCSFDPEGSMNIHNLEVGELNIGDPLISQSGDIITITDIIENTTENEIEVYNFEIEGTHTYYANGILTHNKIAPTAGPRTGNKEDGGQTAFFL